MINEYNPAEEAAMAADYRAQQQQAIMAQQEQEQAALAQQEQQRAYELQRQQEAQQNSYRPPDSTGGYQQAQQETPSLFGLFKGFGGGSSSYQQPQVSNQALEQYRAAQQKAINDDAYRQAMMTNEQRASYMLTRGGGMLAQAIGGMLGGVDPGEARLRQQAQAEQGADLSTSVGLRQAAQGIQDPRTKAAYLQAAQVAEDKELARTASRATSAKTKALDDALLLAKTPEEADAAVLKYGTGVERKEILKSNRAAEKEKSAQTNFGVYYSKRFPDASPEEVAAMAQDPEIRKAIADPTKSMYDHVRGPNGVVIYNKKTGQPVAGGSAKGGFSGITGSGGFGGSGGGVSGKPSGAAIGSGPNGEQVFRTNQGQLFVYGSDGQPVAYQGELLPKQGAGGGKVTEDQAKAAGWVQQMEFAKANIDDALSQDPTIASMPGVEYAAGLVPVIGKDVANVTMSPQRQRYVNAINSLAEAALRAATGAGVNNQEQIQKVRELSPQVGDSAAVLDDKYKALTMYIQAITTRAGAALPPKTPEGGPVEKGPRAGDIVEGHRFLGGDPTNAKNWRKLSQAPKGGAR